MARGRPFFSGNYGGPLGSFDTAAKLIAQSGKAQGDMFANLGTIAADTLDKFREKKEEKEEQDAFERTAKKLPLETFAPFGVTTEDERDALLKEFKKKGNREPLTMLATLAQTGQKQASERKAAEYLLGTPTGAVPPLGTITDPKEYTDTARGIAISENNPFLTSALAKGVAPRVATQQAQTTKREADEASGKKEERETTTGLRKEFTALPEVKEFSKVRTAYNKVKEAGEDPSPAGDLSLIFNYMKILDPGSVVREGEFANAQNATGVPGKIVNFYNQVVDGTRLSPAQRQDFLNQSRKAARAQFTGLDEQMDRYRGIAERNKLPVEDILPENLVAIKEELSAPITTPPDTNQNQGASNRRMDATPSTQLPQPAQQPAPSPSSQNAIQTVLDKAASGEPLTPKEQQLLDLLRQRDLQNRPPQ